MTSYIDNFKYLSKQMGSPGGGGLHGRPGWSRTPFTTGKISVSDIPPGQEGKGKFFQRKSCLFSTLSSCSAGVTGKGSGEKFEGLLTRVGQIENMDSSGMRIRKFL